MVEVFKCPICGATADSKDTPFTRKTLAGHMGGAHPSGGHRGKGMKRMKVAGRSIAATHATGRGSRKAVVREGHAHILPFKGGWMIVVEGIANPFIARQVKMAVVEDEAGEES